MVDLSSVETVEVPREEIPDVFPSLWLPQELYYKQPFFVRLFVPGSYVVGTDPSHTYIDYIYNAIQSKSLRAKCYPTTADIPSSDGGDHPGVPAQARVNPETLRTPIKFCQRCQTQDIIQVSGTKETMGPYRVAIKNAAADGHDWPYGVPQDLYVFVFNQCKSFCSSSRLHLRCNLVLGMSVSSESCFAYSNVFCVLSKIVKKSKKRPPNPTLDSAIPLSVQLAIAEQNNISLLRPSLRQSFSSPTPPPPQPQPPTSSSSVSSGAAATVQQQPQQLKRQKEEDDENEDDGDDDDDEDDETAAAHAPVTKKQAVMTNDGSLSQQSQQKIEDYSSFAGGMNLSTLPPPSPPYMKQFYEGSDYTSEVGTPSALGTNIPATTVLKTSPEAPNSNNNSHMTSHQPVVNCSSVPRQVASPSTSSTASTVSSSENNLTSSSAVAAAAATTTTTVTTTSNPTINPAIPPRRHSPTVTDVLKSPPIPNDQLSSKGLLSGVYSLLRKKFF